MNRITRIEGFEKLTKEQQIDILNYEKDFTGLSKSANTSKGSKAFEEWTIYKKEKLPIDANYREKMMRLEKTLESKLQKMVDNFAKK